MVLKLYKNYLNFLWLWPENAVLDTFRALDFRKVLKNLLLLKQWSILF